MFLLHRRSVPCPLSLIENDCIFVRHFVKRFLIPYFVRKPCTLHGWHVPEPKRRAWWPAKPRPSQAQGRATPLLAVTAVGKVTIKAPTNIPKCLAAMELRRMFSRHVYLARRAADDSREIPGEFRFPVPCCKLLRGSDLGQLPGPRRALAERIGGALLTIINSYLYLWLYGIGGSRRRKECGRR